MIIVEGPDGVGKTTAAKQLCRLGGLAYHHLGPPDEKFDHVGFYLAAIDQGALWDRFHLGEETYGACGFSRRGKWVERVMVREALEKAKACVIVMYASDAKDLVLKPEKDELYTHVQLRAVSARYQEIAETTTWWTIQYDISRFGFPDERVLESWIETWKAGRE